MGARLVWPWPWLDLLGATTHRNWLRGYLNLHSYVGPLNSDSDPMQNHIENHLFLYQIGILPILVMRKLELREGKDFIQGGTANHHLQCTFHL